MTDKKFYTYEYTACPHCGEDLRDVGKSEPDNQTIQCINCGENISEKDIIWKYSIKKANTKKEEEK